MDKRVRTRSLIVGLCFTLSFIGIIAKIYVVQVVQAAWLSEKAEERWRRDEVLRPVRGTIMDRNGKTLAEDAAAYTVAVSPEIILKKQLEREVSSGLAKILASGQDAAAVQRLEAKLLGLVTKMKPDGQTPLSEVEIRNEGYKIDGDTKQQVEDYIEDLKMRTGYKSVGIYLKETQKRYYPFNRLASHALGYIDREGKAQAGLELALDEELKGTPGMLSREKDLLGVELPDAKVMLTPAVNGKHVRLTIDQTIQYYMENALQKSFEKWHPRSMSAIAVNPKTMEILGIANMPDFDPNKYWEVPAPDVFKNYAVASQFEPGSTFKLVTLAAARQEGLFNPNDAFQSGSIKVPGITIHDHNYVGWGRISYMEGLLRSSNVAFVKLGYEKLGAEKLKHYIEAFGFGAKTGVDLPGEIPGVIPMRYPSETATATYGQGLTVTAIQETAAYAAIANGGKLMRPYIVKEVLDPQTHEVVRANEPQVIRQVVSEETAKQVTLDLEQVVANQEMGTGRRAYIQGYRVAGKTGTAQVVLPGEKTYAEGKWLISFIGFAPVEDPRILVTVVADLPDLKGDYHRGGEVAAPVFREIVTQSLSYLGVAAQAAPGKLSNFESTATVPDVTGLSASAAKTTVGQTGLKAEVIGSGANVLKQLPQAGTEISLSQRVYLVTQEEESLAVPNLAGKSLRDALEVCTLLNIKCKTNGEGYVVSQSFNDNSEQRELTLELKPAEEAAAAGGKDAKDDGALTSSAKKGNGSGTNGSASAAVKKDLRTN